MATGDKYKHLIGSKFNRLTIQGEFIIKGKQIHTKVQCECGNIKYSPLGNVLKGRATSCGCFRKELSRNVLTTHGLYRCPEYHVWQNIKRRCYDKTNKNYSTYGGRGIRMYSKWINDFALFRKDVGAKPSKLHSLDRIKVNGNYTPKNCRWATQQEQCNNKRVNKIIFYKREKYTVAEFARKLNINYFSLYHRISNGWEVDDIVNTPIGGKIKKKD